MPVFDESGWTKHALVKVDNSAVGSESLSYFQADIILEGECYADWQSYGKPDGSDLRVVGQDGTLLSHWLENNDGSKLSIKAKVPALAAGAICTPEVRYGNPSATNVSNAAKTIGPSTPIIGPDDVINQSDIVGYNGAAYKVRLTHQHGPNGGGAELNGRILCVSTVGATHAIGVQPLGNAAVGMKYSDDRGKTWSPLTLISGTPEAGHAFSFQMIHELASGKLIACFSYDTNENTAHAHELFYMASSVDGGKTWANLSTTAAGVLIVPWTYGAVAGLPYGNFIEVTPGGDILKLCYAKHVGDPGSTGWLIRCPAGLDPVVGSNWVTHGTIWHSTTQYFNETACIQTTDENHMIAIIRSDAVGDTGDFRKAYSTDGGKTWGPLSFMGFSNTSDPGLVGRAPVSPYLYRLPVSGNIALVFGVRWPYPGAWGAGCVISTDNGDSFMDRGCSIPIGYSSATTTRQFDFGYPSIVQNEDGSIVITVFYAPDATGASSNVSRVICDEDWLVNSPNVYLDCEAFTPEWASHGANVTISTDRPHSGTRSMKVDNSAGGGVGSMIKLWSRISKAQAALRIAYSYWVYCSRMAPGMGHGGSVADGSGKMRTSVNVLATNRHLQWYDGTKYRDTGLSVSDGAWHKVSVRAEMTPTTVKGTASVDGGPPFEIGQRMAGSGAVALSLGAGTTSGPSATTVYFDDIYSQQYAAVPPIVSVSLPSLTPCQS